MKFGKLTIMSSYTISGRRMCVCKCECGAERVIQHSNLVYGNTKSCGCTGKYGKSTTRHGDSYSSLYNRYIALKPYLCNLWKDDYQEFKKWALDHGFKDNLIISRLDLDKEYSPENCFLEQNRISKTHRSCKRDGLSSKYKGVYFKKSEGVWASAITKSGKHVYIGRFSNENDAARAYNKKARELYGDIAYQNVIEED